MQNCRLFKGVSFAGVATILAIVTTGGGLASAFGAVIVASLIGLLLAPFFSKIIRYFVTMTSILGYSAYVKTFLSFFKKTINHQPTTINYSSLILNFFTAIVKRTIIIPVKIKRDFQITESPVPLIIIFLIMI